MVKYDEVFRAGHGLLQCKVCDQCDRREHVDMVGWHGHHQLEHYWFCALACLHDAERGVIPRAWQCQPETARALRDLPPPLADTEGWLPVR